MHSDITAFVETEIRKLPGITGRLGEEVRQALVDGSNGMFLWVALLVDDLKKFTNSTHQAIRKALKMLPPDLAGVYTNILRKIRTKDQPVAQAVLRWVVWAVRPLTIPELTIAIAILPEHTCMSSMHDDMQPDLRKVLRLIFGPLLRIEDDDTIHLVHQSAKDFLSNMDLSPDALPHFSLASAKSNFRLAMACLTYLCFDECEDEPVAGHSVSEQNVKQNIKIRKRKLEFLDYAATHWPEHTRMADKADHQALSGLFGKLAQSPNKIDLAYQILVLSRNEKFQKTAPLQIAASLGFVTFVKDFLDCGADINAQGGIHGSALQAAACNGHEAVVRLLIDLGADIHAQCGTYSSALQAAAENGQEAIVRLLIDRSADINAHGGIHGSSLQAPAEIGHKAIVRLLHDRGADIKSHGGMYGSALQAAAYNGHENLVRLLIDRGADVNAEGGSYGNALQAAVNGRQGGVVRLLLDSAADLTKLDDEGQILASEMLHKTISTEDSDSDAESLLSCGSILSEQSSLSSQSFISSIIQSVALAQAEDIMARTLGISDEISQVVSKAAATWSKDKIDRQIRRAVKEFSEHLVEHAAEGSLVLERIPILLRTRASPIARKIRELSDYNCGRPVASPGNERALHKYLQENKDTKKTYQLEKINRFMEDDTGSMTIESGVRPAELGIEEEEVLSDTSAESNGEEDPELQQSSGLVEGQQAVEQSREFLARQDISELFLQAVRRNFLKQKVVYFLYSCSRQTQNKYTLIKSSRNKSKTMNKKLLSMQMITP